MDWLFGNAAWVRCALNAWPPFWGAGIKIETLSPDFRFCRVTLKSRWWNKNANRTQFGGSMFAMTDPIYPLMLMGYFKNRYYVWDKAGSINFIKPGKGKLVAEFTLSDAKLASIVAATEGGGEALSRVRGAGAGWPGRAGGPGEAHPLCQIQAPAQGGLNACCRCNKGPVGALIA
ncbi:hypothetical protein KAM364_04490 [Aeromonas caviae]|nr:hypothetical protein KAM364_04490 [Aeromonas caviae]